MKCFSIITFFFLSFFCFSQQQIKGDFLKQEILKLDNFQDKLAHIESRINNDLLVKDDIYKQVITEFQVKAIQQKKWENALFLTNQLLAYHIYTSLNSKKAFTIASEFEPYLINCNTIKNISDFYIYYSQAATFLQKFDSSLQIIDNAISFLKEEEAEDTPSFAQFHLIAGENNSKVNNLIKSVTYFEGASKLFLNQKDTISFLWSQNGLSRLLGNNGLYKEAEEARGPIFSWKNKVKVKDVVVMAHITASIEGTMEGNSKKELFHIKKALELKSQMSSDTKDIIEILTHACATYIFARYNLLDESDENLRKLNILMKAKKSNDFLNTYYSLALSQNLYMHGKFEESKNILLAAIGSVKQSKETENILDYEYLLAEAYQGMGDLKKSLFHFKNYAALKDSIQKSISRKRFAYVQTQFNIEKKDLEISKQRKNIDLLNAKSEIKTQWMVVGGISSLFLFIVLYLLRSKQFAKRKQEIETNFSRKLLKGQEDERTRLARELHDGVGQQLTLIKRKTQHTQQSDLTQLTHQVLEEVRAISRGLYPPMLDKLGLSSSLNQLIFDLDNDTPIFFTADINNIDNCLTKYANVHLYRFMQECINNIIKHAKASAVEILVKQKENRIFIEIIDNGKGFDLTKVKVSKSLGLKTLSERIKILKGNFLIESSPNNGTIIKASIPCKP